MVLQPFLPAIVLAALIGAPDGAEARPAAGAGDGRRTDTRTTNRWVSMVVTRITRAGEAVESEPKRGIVTIRVRIGADGTLAGAAVEESSGSPTLDERALRAVNAAAPFVPPPKKLLTLEGFTELSFPVELARPATARP